ncbi:hypothetical protein RND81_03G222000 [Saponaria officinalis]|uniref:DEK-C domain-containing protein n=1 Tax=Saponaria officinalis TaxID=3572 RepID=A0AAW1MCB5_SAPOF
MDHQTRRQITTTVTDILKTADLNSVTEKHVRDLTADKLRLDLSDLPHKILIRQIVESFLLDENNVVSPSDNGQFGDDVVETKPVVADSCRVICKLSQKRDVAVRCSGGKTVVSIREFFGKDGKQILSPKWISLSPDQWSTFRKNIPAIEEAITKIESRLRPQVEKTQTDADKSESVRHQNDFRRDTGKQVSNGSTVSSTPRRQAPTDIVRFDGKNYQLWAEHMESYLNHLKVGYVLSEPCPSAARVADWEIAETLTVIDKWIDDDRVCRQNIISTLCDNMFSHYSKKAGLARDLWEELKVIYLYEEHGAKISLVKKYIEFQIVEEKPIFDQVQELNHIADSLIAAGMYVEEKLHVNVIISKLPPSWKPYSIDLMKEDYLPVWMLMNQLKAEEEFRQTGNRTEAPRSRRASPVFNHAKKVGPHRIPMKRPGTSREMDHERRVRFCNICKKNNHLPEQCFFRDSSWKDTSVETNNVMSANFVAEGVKEEAAEPSNS